MNRISKSQTDDWRTRDREIRGRERERNKNRNGVRPGLTDGKVKEEFSDAQKPAQRPGAQVDMNTLPGTSPEAKLSSQSREADSPTPPLTLQPRWDQGISNSPFSAPSTAQSARVPRARSMKGKRPLSFMVRAGEMLTARPPNLYLHE